MNNFLKFIVDNETILTATAYVIATLFFLALFIASLLWFVNFINNILMKRWRNTFEGTLDRFKHSYKSRDKFEQKLALEDLVQRWPYETMQALLNMWFERDFVLSREVEKTLLNLIERWPLDAIEILFKKRFFEWNPTFPIGAEKVFEDLLQHWPLDAMRKLLDIGVRTPAEKILKKLIFSVNKDDLYSSFRTEFPRLLGIDDETDCYLLDINEPKGIAALYQLKDLNDFYEFKTEQQRVMKYLSRNADSRVFDLLLYLTGKEGTSKEATEIISRLGGEKADLFKAVIFELEQRVPQAGKAKLYKIIPDAFNLKEKGYDFKVEYQEEIGHFMEREKTYTAQLATSNGETPESQGLENVYVLNVWDCNGYITTEVRGTALVSEWIVDVPEHLRVVQSDRIDMVQTNFALA